MRRAHGQATAWLLAATALVAWPVEAPAAEAYGIYRRIDHHIDTWHPEDALPLLDELADEAGDDPLVHLARGRVLFHLGRYAQAVEAFDALEAQAGAMPAYAQTIALARATAERTAEFVPLAGDHFTVWTDPGADRMLAPFALETLEAALQALTIDLGIQIPDEALPIRVEIYPRVEDFVAVSTLTEDEVATSGTVALCKFNRLMIVSPRRMARGYRWQDTLGHELVHFVLSRGTRNRLPLFLHEGIAKFEERRWRSPEIGVLQPIQQSILDEARRKDVYVPFGDMMPSLAKLESGWQTALGFAEVTMLIGHIVEDRGMPGLREIVRGYGESDAAGKAALGMTDEDQLWRQFLARLKTAPLNPVPGYKFIPPSVAEDPDEAEPEPIAQASAKKFTRLGDLLREQGHWAAAVTEYNKVEAELGYRPAPLSLKLAESLMLGARYTQAEAELRDLILRDPDRATAHYLLGKIAMFKNEPQEALDRFEFAFGVAPFTNQVLDGLVDVSERLGDETRLQKYRQAREIYHAHRN